MLVIVLVLVGLGIWWWLGRSDGAPTADGADSPGEAIDVLVERINSDHPTEIFDSMSPAEQQYGSALTSLLMRYAWDADIDMGIDEAEAQERVREAIGRYSEAVDYAVSIDAREDVSLTSSMTAVVVTDGTITVSITDIDKFGEITADLLEEIYTEEQIQRNFGVQSTDELKDMIADQLRQGETEFSGEFSDEVPLILMTVEEEKGWYVSPVSSMAAYAAEDFFLDENIREDFVQRNGPFTLAEPEKAATAEEATENFVNALSNERIPDLLGYLPLAEQRALGLLLYLAEVPEVGLVRVGHLIALSNLTTVTIPISDHSALSMIETLQIDLNPAFAGQAMQVILDSGTLTVGSCAPIDISPLLTKETPLLAFAVIEDESGWNVSLLGTVLNTAGAGSTLDEGIEEYSYMLEELESCMSF